MRRVVIALLAPLLVISALGGQVAGQTPSVVLSDVHMARFAGPGQPAVTSFPSGTVVVAFDYTVVQPSSDAGEVDIYLANDLTVLFARDTVTFDAAGPQAVVIPAPQSTYPDGAYCTVLAINGVPQTGNGLPLAWKVGSFSIATCTNPFPVQTGTPATPTQPSTASPTPTPTPTPVTPVPTVTPVPQPSGTITPVLGSPIAATPAATSTPTPTPTPTGTPAATPVSTLATGTPTHTAAPSTTPTAVVHLKSLVVDTTGALRVRRMSNVRIQVHGTHGHPIRGVTVSLDARAVGIARHFHARTGSHGYVTFRRLRPARPGLVTITATKPGYRTRSITVRAL